VVGPRHRTHHPRPAGPVLDRHPGGSATEPGWTDPVQATAWYHKAEPTFVDCLALVRRHLWCARYLVHSAAKAECEQFPREAVDLLINGFPLAA
jgi:hypothetical protein